MPTVLLIEDNEPNLYMMSFLLERNGFEVVAARSGEEALRMLGDDVRPTVILTDLQLPAMDGYEVVRRLKRDPRTAEIPVVAVSAYAMPGVREKVLELGCRGYFEKPISVGTFVEDLNGLLGG